MSSNSALYIATTSLNAQSTNLSMISTNLANEGTVGYKSADMSFRTLITDPYSQNSTSSGGVMYSSRQNVSSQGLIEAAAGSTDMAIDGGGFFVVTDGSASDDFAYTRSGGFSADAEGYLVNESGYYLQGWPLDASGSTVTAANGSVSSLEAVNISAVTGSAAATTEVGFVANLPADAAVGDAFTTSSEIYDSLGVSHTVDYTWQKTGLNAWDLSFSDPVSTADPTVTTGTSTGGPVSITFNPDGTLAGTVPAAVDLSITGWSMGASDSTITYDLGTSGRTDGLSQYASSNGTNPAIDLTSASQNGLRLGVFETSYVDETGKLIATFDNGQERPIYQLPLATFNNPDGLIAGSGNVYFASEQSGDYVLNNPGSGGAGFVLGFALESSTVNTSEELTNMITAQQAYSAASQIISTSDEMFRELMNAL